jgi:hypothetical protein
MFYDNHCNYLGNDYFLCPKFREEYKKYENNDLFYKFIIRDSLSNYELISDRYSLSFTLYGNIWDKLRIIDNYEMRFEKQVLKIDGTIYYMRNEELCNKKKFVFGNDDTKVQYMNHKIFMNNVKPIKGAIYRNNYSQKLDLNIRKERVFNNKIPYLFLFNESFSLFIFEEYLINLPGTAINLIRLFIGSTRYIIRSVMRNNCYFNAMKSFNKMFEARCKKNFLLKQLNAKEYIPSKSKNRKQQPEEKK